MREIVQRFQTAAPMPAAADPHSAARLQALGYVGGSKRAADTLADPKDRRDLAAGIARVTSGELRGNELERTLRRLAAADPSNPQVNMRLGFVLQESGRCPEARRFFQTAIDGGIPGADAHLGLAGCYAEARLFDEAARVLRDAQRADPENPVVAANLGIVLADAGRPARAIPPLERALALDPDFHEARFNLARVLARAGRLEAASKEVDDLLRRLPDDAPQRAEVQRLRDALRGR
jgi:Flp pilus assembly protein TadD